MKKILISLLLLISMSLGAKNLTGNVVRVLDGDTIEVLDEENVSHRIRLSKIDAPEKAQPYGARSKQYLSSLIYNKKVSVVWDKHDRYGRVIGEVFIGDINVNLQMVKEGLAWHYKHFDDSKSYAQAENDARTKKIGLWQDPNPLNPHDFRKNKK